ncbi:MAG: amidohydrolase family protein, partial [Actinomycetota bacterium]|nr:amidohydrolase family protein [Actinomycetota bacterium]
VHVAPEALLLAWRAGAGRLAVVSDAIAAAQCGDGTFRLGSVEVVVRGNQARRADGTLAGSLLSMDQAIRNLVEAGVPMVDAVAAATRVPGRLVDGRAGILEEGGPADVVVLDEDLNVTGVWVGGAKLR